MDDFNLFNIDIPYKRIFLYLFLSTIVLGNISAYLKKRCIVQDGYSRKINHIGIMIISVPLILFLPEKELMVSVILSSIGLILIYAISACDCINIWWVQGVIFGSLRERDKPHEKFFLFFPLITFNASLVVMVLLYPLYAVKIAFYTVALADGFAEPFGLKFGKNNSYYVRDFFWRTANKKSIAGNITVLFFSSMVFIVFAITIGKVLSLSLIMVSIFYGISVSFLESVSPRGMDNMLMVVLCTPLSVYLLSII